MQISNTSKLAGIPLQRRRTHKIMKTLPYHGKVNNTQQQAIHNSAITFRHFTSHITQYRKTTISMLSYPRLNSNTTR